MRAVSEPEEPIRILSGDEGRIIRARVVDDYQFPGLSREVAERHGFKGDKEGRSAIAHGHNDGEVWIGRRLFRAASCPAGNAIRGVDPTAPVPAEGGGPVMPFGRGILEEKDQVSAASREADATEVVLSGCQIRG